MTVDDPADSGAAGAARVASILHATQPWVRFFGVLGLVSAAVMVLVGLAAGTVGIATGDVETAILLVVYPLLGVLYVFPSLHLLRYAKGIRHFAQSGAEHDLAGALDAQRSFWKFLGILTLASLALLMIGIIAAVLIGIAAGLRLLQ